MAEALLKQALPQVRVFSAGTQALDGMPADPIAVQLLQEWGVDITSHRATRVNQLLCQNADLILVAEQKIRLYLESKFPNVRGKVYRICESSKLDIPDPISQPRADFERCLSLIEQGCNDWIKKIQAL